MGIYFTEQEARFLLRVLPEALGIPLSELGGTVISRLEALTERVLARDEKAAALDRAIVEAAERWHDSHVSSRIGEHDQCAIELRRAVEAKRSATSSPSSAGRKDGERG